MLLALSALFQNTVSFFRTEQITSVKQYHILTIHCCNVQDAACSRIHFVLIQVLVRCQIRLCSSVLSVVEILLVRLAQRHKSSYLSIAP